MKAKPGDAFRGALEPDGVVVEFGQAVPAEAGAAGVQLSDRIVLPVETARRLRLALDESLRQRPPAAVAGDPGPDRAPEGATLRGRTPVNAPPDPAGEKAALLLRLVGELGVPYQHERSFRISAGFLTANRYLLTVDKRDIQGEARVRALSICGQLGMPPELREQAAERFDIARCIHFGFEAGPGNILCKLYLERSVGEDERAAAMARAEPVLLHLAFKWDTDTGSHVVTRYLWHPGLAPGQVEERIAGVYRAGAGHPGLEMTRAVLREAASRVPPEQVQYLEVLEAENGRRSFDLNLYAAGLRLRELQGALYGMRDHFGVQPGRFQALYDQIKGRSFGHLAGGVHRDGREFFNVYYGVEGFPRFNEPGPGR